MEGVSSQCLGLDLPWIRSLQSLQFLNKLERLCSNQRWTWHRAGITEQAKSLNWASKHRENTYTIERDLDRHAKSFVIIREYVVLLGWKDG